MKGRLHPALIVRCAAYLYIAHILLLGKIALLELSHFWCGFYLCWALTRREMRASFHILYFPLLAYAVATSVSSLAAGIPEHLYSQAIVWFKILIFPVAIILLREVPGLRDLQMYIYAIFGGGIACWGLLEFLFESSRDLEHRINGPVSHVMTYSGLLMTMSLVFLVFWWHQRRHWQLAVAVVASIALVLTYTRSAWLGWMAAVLMLLLASRIRRRAMWLFPAVLLLVTFMPMSLFGRLISTLDFKQTSNFDRIRMVQAGVEMIRDHPLFGIGPGNVKENYTLYRLHDAPRPRPPHLHNNVVQIWAERGVLGLAAYLTFLALFVRECLRERKGPLQMWAHAGLAMTMALTVAGLFEFNFGDTEVFYLMLNVMAYLLVSIEKGVTNTPVPVVVAPQD